ncbi:MAG: S8 family peptidase [Lachnospiraceae bacterium]|nr:S8 family peptidase [Lachnospiraceae bacterium]
MDCSTQVYAEDFYDLIVDRENEVLGAEDICQQKIGEQYTVFYVDSNTVPSMDIGVYRYATIPKCYTILDQSALEVSGIIKAQTQRTLDLKGQGILIGFVDTGIRYENSAFRTTDGSSRIVAIWDQTVDTQNHPQGFIYGTEYSKEEIDAALIAENPQALVPVRDENGHGTRMASIAAGSEDIENDFIGAAPYADIAVVKLKPAKRYLRDFYFIREDAVAYQENDILAGVEYLRQLAELRGQPLVLCIGLGTNQGDHGGGDRISSFMDSIALLYRHAVCIAVGNEANARHHFFGKVKEEETEKVEMNVSEDMRGLVMEIWGRAPELFAISITSPTGEVLPRVPVWNGQQQRHRFLLENTSVVIDYQLTGIRSRDQLIYVRFENLVSGLWVFEVFPYRVLDVGNYNMYLPISEFLEEEVYFLRSSPDSTLTVPSSAELPMAVGGYDAVSDAFYIDSGRGFSVSGDIKPDFIAPAVNVYAQNQFGQYDYMTGTSAAAAIAAGASALLLEWNINYLGNRIANSIEIKNQLINGAVQQENQVYPNREEGYGRLDVYQAILNMRNL